MALVDQVIHDRLHSEVALINKIGEHIIASGGKRLRPALVVLSANVYTLDVVVRESDPSSLQLLN